MEKREYIIYFDFTTYHANSRFIGRSGQLAVNCKVQPDIEKDKSEIESLIAAFIHSKKPKWKIFMIQIKNITELIKSTQ